MVWSLALRRAGKVKLMIFCEEVLLFSVPFPIMTHIPRSYKILKNTFLKQKLENNRQISFTLSHYH